MRAIMLVWIVGLMGTGGTLPDEELGALLQELEKKLGAIDSIKSEFVQEKHLSLFEEKVVSKGLLLFLRPDRLRFETTQPFHSVLIAGGKKVAKYECIDGRWERLKMGGRETILMVLEQIASWLQGRFRDKENLYEISARPGDPVVLVLTPRDPAFREHLAAIELTLARDRSRIEGVLLRELGGDYTVIRFCSQTLNAALDDRLFDTKEAEPSPVPEDLFSAEQDGEG